MQYPYPATAYSTPQGFVALQSNVQLVVNAINANLVIPYGDYGGPNVYWFTPMNNALGNIVYTVFDRGTRLGLVSMMVRYGAAATINQILFQPFPRTEVELRYLLLPPIPTNSIVQGTVIPQ